MMRWVKQDTTKVNITYDTQEVDFSTQVKFSWCAKVVKTININLYEVDIQASVGKTYDHGEELINGISYTIKKEESYTHFIQTLHQRFQYLERILVNQM
jgi:hypothetical protein